MYHLYGRLPSSSGKTLSIKAHGNFTETVQAGSYIKVQVKYGLITLLNNQFDLCEQMSNVDEECPLSGEKTITKDVEIPKKVPPVIQSLLSTSRIIQLTANSTGNIQSNCGRLYYRRRPYCVSDGNCCLYNLMLMLFYWAVNSLAGDGYDYCLIYARRAGLQRLQ